MKPSLISLMFSGALAALALPTLTLAQLKHDAAAIVITVDAKNTAQKIDNIGASGCWFSEGIGKYWPIEKKEKIAELLFSRELSENGSPKGIGLSAWRFNIGAGTAEQGSNSGIKDFRRRVECFLSPEGEYDWSKQAGSQWFLQKAKAFGVKDLIAFSNSPPVQFTKNGLGFKTEKDFISNLKPDKYSSYANFLLNVLKHFDKQGIHFNYVSPVNEPQWDWAHKPGEATQEGSPWTNYEINEIVGKLDTALKKSNVSTSILFPEAAKLTFLYSRQSNSSMQARQFFGRGLDKFTHVPPIIAGHSYFTDTGDSTIITVRKE